MNVLSLVLAGGRVTRMEYQDDTSCHIDVIYEWTTLHFRTPPMYGTLDDMPEEMKEFITLIESEYSSHTKDGITKLLQDPPDFNLVYLVDRLSKISTESVLGVVTDGVEMYETISLEYRGFEYTFVLTDHSDEVRLPRLINVSNVEDRKRQYFFYCNEAEVYAVDINKLSYTLTDSFKDYESYVTQKWKSEIFGLSDYIKEQLLINGFTPILDLTQTV